MCWRTIELSGSLKKRPHISRQIRTRARVKEEIKTYAHDSPFALGFLKKYFPSLFFENAPTPLRTHVLLRTVLFFPCTCRYPLPGGFQILQNDGRTSPGIASRMPLCHRRVSTRPTHVGNAGVTSKTDMNTISRRFPREMCRRQGEQISR